MSLSRSTLRAISLLASRALKTAAPTHRYTTITAVRASTRRVSIPAAHSATPRSSSPMQPRPQAHEGLILGEGGGSLSLLSWQSYPHVHKHIQTGSLENEGEEENFCG
ncbi:hypothetical protein ACOMHN_019615 [Nucella lapillus]